MRPPLQAEDGLPEVVVDGMEIDSLDAFFAAFVSSAHAEECMGLRLNLDGFNDVLRGGFGTPDEGFTLRWRNHEVSRARLGHAATARWLEAKQLTCHPTNVESVREELADARAGRGPTLFDVLVQIVRDHGPGGAEAEDNVVLVLD